MKEKSIFEQFTRDVNPHVLRGEEIRGIIQTLYLELSLHVFNFYL